MHQGATLTLENYGASGPEPWYHGASCLSQALKAHSAGQMRRRPPPLGNMLNPRPPGNGNENSMSQATDKTTTRLNGCSQCSTVLDPAWQAWLCSINAPSKQKQQIYAQADQILNIMVCPRQKTCFQTDPEQISLEPTGSTSLAKCLALASPSGHSSTLKAHSDNFLCTSPTWVTFW